MPCRALVNIPRFFPDLEHCFSGLETSFFTISERRPETKTAPIPEAAFSRTRML